VRYIVYLTGGTAYIITGPLPPVGGEGMLQDRWCL
jgi:hypothetical protein